MVVCGVCGVVWWCVAVEATVVVIIVVWFGVLWSGCVV